MADSNNIYGLSSVPVVVPPGATLAVLRVGTEGQQAQLLKYFSGGSVSIIGITPLGATYSAAELVSAGNSGGYLLGTNEVVSIDGAARYYLMATGATAVVMQLKGLSQGF